jgi:NAD(P)-dependent dehydrogenase (short-subunit alcohol dehydrogenase family)
VNVPEQVAFITGGASGIGRAVAAALVAKGVRTIIGDLDPEVGTVASKLGAVRGIRLDVTDAGEVEATIGAIGREFGGLHILGNIAGIYRRAAVVDMTPAQWDETLNANLRSVFLCTRFALPRMIEQRYGRVISIASGLAVVGTPRGSAYAASKAGLIAFTKSAASEVFALGITVNCIAPGITDTPLMRNANSPEEIATAVSRSGRPLGKPEDAVAPFLFLLSEGASSVSGVTLWMKNP